MAWPPSSGAGTFTVKNSGSIPTTIAWGTDGICSGVIVISFESNLMTEEIKIDNGTGLTAALIGLNDGTEGIMTVVDDRALTFPDWMSTITLIDPRPTGAGGTSTLFQVIQNNYRSARKQEGQRAMLVRKYTLITPT